MTVRIKLTRILAAATLSLAMMTPAAFAQQYNGRHSDHHEGRRGGQHHTSHDRRRDNHEHGNWHNDHRRYNSHHDYRNFDPWHGAYPSWSRSYGGANIFINRQSPYWRDRHYQRAYRRPVYSSPHHTHHQTFRIGDHYRTRQTTVYVNDYRYWGLRTPPRHHHWVRDHDDALLISVTTGAIIGLVVGAFATGY